VDRPLTRVWISRDDRRIHALSFEGDLRVWEADPTREVRMLRGHPVVSASFSADGSAIVTGAANGSVKAWGAKTGRQFASHKEHSAPVTAVSISEDSTRLISRDVGGKTVVWDIETEMVLPDVKDTVSPPRLESPDGTWKLVLDRGVRVEQKQP
jgi:WD40 repeat protein